MHLHASGIAITNQTQDSPRIGKLKARNATLVKFKALLDVSGSRGPQII